MDNIPWLDTQFPHQAYPGDNMASGYGYAIAPSAYPQLPPQSYAEPPSQLASSFDNAGIGGGAAYLFSSSPEPYLDVPAGNRVSTSPMLARSAPATLHVPPPANQQQQQGLQLQLPQSATAQLQEPSPFFLAQSLPRLALNPPFGPASQPVQPFQAQFQQSPQYQQQYQQPGQQQYQQPTSQQYQRDQQNNHLQLQPQPPPSSSPQLDFQSDFGLGLPQATQIEPGEAPSNSTPMQAQPAAMLRSTSIDPMALFATGPPLGVSRDLSNNRLVSPFTDYATGTNTSLFAGGTSMVRSQSARLPSGTGGLVLRSDPSEVRAAPYTLPSRLPRMPKTPVTPADRRFIAWTWPSPSPGATGTTTQRTTSSPSPPMVSSDGSVGASAGRKRIRAVPVRATPAQRYILDLEFATNQ